MNYPQAVSYLDSFANYEASPSRAALRDGQLGRMHALCRELGHPERRFRTVVVGGTNGKANLDAD